MKHRLSIVSSLFLLSVIFISIVLATSFTSTVNPNTADSGLTNKFLNFTINNAGPGNITQVNITLYSGLTFVLDSNGTDASNANFTNISSTLISWGNTTSLGFINTTQYFWFNVSIPKTTYGSINFNVSTNDTSGSFNSTNVSITVDRTVWSSPLEQFYIKPTGIRLNWTNNYTSNLTITLNTSFSNITVEVLNSSVVSANYSQSNSQTQCQAAVSGYYLYVRNISGGYNNIVSNDTNVTLVDNVVFNHLTCSPGRYWIERLTIRNYTQTNESANITIFIDIPISSSNNANIQTTGTGSFSGSLPINTTYYHSYYFNTSLFTNATVVLVNASGWSSSQDVDIFLLDGSGNLKAKSINKSSTNESLLYNYLPLNETWEIRVYGNSTSSAIPYSGNIIFTTLNVTNSSNSSLQISSIDFGIMNASDTKQSSITLKNEGNLNITNVKEYKELYYAKRFSGSSAQNFSLIVPDSSIASKVKISLNWTGGSNYSFELYNQSGVLVANSTNKYVYANRSGVMQEEYSETNVIGSSVGVWRVEVKNNTNIADSYSVAAYVYVNASAWIVTNYTNATAGFTFNMTGRENSTYGIQINFTIQNNTLDGLYEGSIQYLDVNRIGVKIPIYVNVTAPMLVVNNTMVSMIGRVDENYGANITRYNMTFILNNTGFYDLVVNMTDSNSTLRCTSGGCGNYTANFTYNQISSIGKYSSQTIRANVTFNSSLPIGVYDGWIFVNATNATTALSSHPYSSFNITVRLNLTSLLDVRILEVNTTVPNATAGGNITIKTKVYYINGTEIEAGNILSISNFTVWLVETNASYRIPSSGNLTIDNGTNPIYLSGNYSILAIVPANQPGGRYGVYVNATYTRNPSFSGIGTSSSLTLIISNAGLNMTTPNSTSISVTNSSNSMFAVNISNFGPNASTGGATSIQFTETCTGASVLYTSSSGGCVASQSGDTFNLSVPAYNTSCLVWWTINVPAGSASESCTGRIIGVPSNVWFNPNGINVSVTVTAPSGAGAGTGSGAGTTTIPAYVADLSFTKAESLIIVRQNSTNTTEVSVKNTGNKTQHINLTIEGINSTWYTLNSTLASLATGKSAGFLVTFSIGNVESKDYSGTFKANSTDKSVTSSFTLRVTPAPAKQIEINDTIAQYRLNFTKLGEEINQSKKEGLNVTLAEQKYNITKIKLEEVENLAKQGDYFGAYQKLDGIKSLLNEAWTELNKAEEAKPFEWKWIYIGIGIVVVVVGAYLFWPSQSEYRPGEKRYESSGKESVWNQLKNKWDEIRKKSEEK